MSQNDTESADPSSIGDDRLPEDLVASDDNPLAEGLPTGEDVHVREEGKRAEQMSDPDDDPDGDPTARTVTRAVTRAVTPAGRDVPDTLSGSPPARPPRDVGALS